MKLLRLEAMRGLAAFSVLLAHAQSVTATDPAIHFGRWYSVELEPTLGVQFFFVLSGFVMALTCPNGIGRTPNIGPFLWRRACRIYPLYWIVAAYAVWRFRPDATWFDIPTWASLLPLGNDLALDVAWTLRHEVVFYLLFAICLLPRIGKPALALWVAGTFFLWNSAYPLIVQVPSATLAVYFHTPLTLLFFAGLLAGTLLPHLPAQRLTSWTLCGLGAAIVACRLPFDQWGAEYGPPQATVLYGIGYASLILGLALSDRLPRHALQGRRRAVAATAGTVSYPLYLCHVMAIYALLPWMSRSGVAAGLGPFGCFATFVVGSVIVASVLAFGIDRPLQRILRRWPAAPPPRSLAITQPTLSG